MGSLQHTALLIDVDTELCVFRRDWNYVPVICTSPGSDWGPRRRRSCSVGSCSDSDAEPTVTICRRVGGVFHYIPAQRLLKSATAAAGGPV